MPTTPRPRRRSLVGFIIRFALGTAVIIAAAIPLLDALGDPRTTSDAWLGAILLLLLGFWVAYSLAPEPDTRHRRKRSQ